VGFPVQIAVNSWKLNRLESSLRRVLADVRARIVPQPGDRAKMSSLAKRLSGEVAEILESSGVEADVSVQGSFARDTWLRGEADLDVFTKFSEDVDRNDWTGKFLPAIRRGLGRYRQVERFAEHPYLELWADSVRVNVVPCYAVEKGKWKSATDRTPYHTEYMRSNLTGTLRDEARLLKQFAKGVGVYGAEIRVGGFSGMLVDTLLLEYPSFVETLKAASGWPSRVFVDVANHAGEVDRRRFESDFVVVDPVDPERNLAAAVREDKLWTFVAAAREFLRKPQPLFFFPGKPRVPSRQGFSRRLKSSGNDFIVAVFSHPGLVSDVLWGQLFRVERAFVGLLGRHDFRVLRSEAWSNEKGLGSVFLEVERAGLPSAQLHMGPPVSRTEESQRFLDRHLSASDTIRGPWLSRGRWAVVKTRRIKSVEALLKVALKDSTYGLVVPEQLKLDFLRTMQVLLNEEVLRFLAKPGLGAAFWKFLDGRPSWLKSSRS